MATTPAGPYTPATPTLNGTLDHADVHQGIADDIGVLTTGAATESSQRIAGDTARQLLSEKGLANGYAGLDTNGKVPAAQLPAVSGAPSGPAGGSLSGTYPDPGLAADAVGASQIQTNAVGSLEIANNAVTATQLADNAVTTSKIVTDAVTNLSLANMVQATVKGRVAGSGTGDPQDLTAGQATAILDTFTTSLKGLAPSSGGGTANFLRADGTWQPPPGGAPSGTAGGSLSGTYPNPTLATDSVAAAQILNGSVGQNEIQAAAIYDTHVAGTAAIANAKLANMGANTIKGALGAGAPVNLTAAEAAVVLASGSGGGTSNFLCADGSWQPPPGGAPSGTAGGSLAGTYPNPTIAANAITATELGPSSVTAGKIFTDAVSNLKLANMATNTIKGRVTTATGDPEDLTPAQARTVIASDSGGGVTNYLRADGTWAAPAGGGGGLAAVTIADSATIDLSGDGTAGSPLTGGIPAGSITATQLGSLAVVAGKINTGAVTTNSIADANVSNAKLADMATHTVKGNMGASAAAPADVNMPGLTANLVPFQSASQGVVPASGGGTANFLRADGTWAAVATGLNLTAVKTTAYTAAVNDDVICDAGATGFAVTLPATPVANGSTVRVRVYTGAGLISMNPGAGGAVIHGSLYLSVTGQYWGEYRYDSAAAIWRQVGGITLQTSLSAFAPPAGPLGMNNQRIAGLGLATSGTDALSQDAGDARYAPTAAGTATGTTFTPTGTIAATNVQAAIAEVSGDVTALPTLTTSDTVKVPISTATGVTTLNVNNLATLADITASGAITVKDEGTNLTTGLASLDFTGAGVTATNTAGAVTVNVAGGGSSGTSYVRASTDGTAVNNSSTYVNDPTMILAVAANAVYEVSATIFHDASINADCNIGWVFPAGCTGEYWTHKVLDTAAANTLTVSTSTLTAWGSGTSCGGVNASPNTTTTVVYVRGTLIVGSTAGNLQLKFSQKTPTAENTYRKAGSIIILRQLA